ncbi:hypothetical protein RSN44_004809 [Escherichia coli]|nr:hypothetical protein [Escherichia coli]
MTLGSVDAPAAPDNLPDVEVASTTDVESGSKSFVLHAVAGLWKFFTHDFTHWWQFLPAFTPD